MDNSNALRVISEFSGTLVEQIETNRQLLDEISRIRHDLERVTGEVSGAQWVGTRRAAEHLGVSENYLRELSDEGKIPHSLVGSVRRYHLPTIDRWLQEVRHV